MFKKSSIARSLLIYIVLCSTLITLLLTAFQLYRDYRIDINLINHRLDQIKVTNLTSLNENLWAVNQHVLKVQLEDMVNLPDIEYLVIYNHRNEMVTSAGQAVIGDKIQRSYSMTHTFVGEQIVLGNLTIQASLQGVYQRLKDKVLVILVSQGLKTFLVSAFILFIVHWLVTRHLLSLLKYARNLSAEQLHQKPDLPDLSTRNDELSELFSAIHQMQNNLANSFEAIKRSREQFESIFEGSNDAILLIDPGLGVILDSNPMASRMLGYSKQEFSKMPIEKIHPNELQQLNDFFTNVANNSQGWSDSLSCISKTGELIPAEVSASIIDIDHGKKMLAIVRDHRERRLQEEKIAFLALHDGLTLLSNREHLSDQLYRSIVHAQRQEKCGAILFLDIDNFKNINDSLGHSVGDDLLVTLAERLNDVSRESDMVARLGGDEFVILLGNLEDNRSLSLQNAQQFAQKVRNSLQHTFLIDGRELHITSSIGIASFPDDGETVEEILKHADAAMYKAKSDGKDTERCYDPQMGEYINRQLMMHSELRRAIDREEFTLAVQPKVLMKGKRVMGCEALIRWQHPERGLVVPDEFIPYLEDSGLIVDVGYWVLEEACKFWQSRKASGESNTDGHIAVNVSLREFNHPDYCKRIFQILEKTGLPPHNLELELTEKIMISDLRDTVSKMNELRKVGISLAIDDFGTGYSSLSYLHQLPVQVLKIDRSFISQIGQKNQDFTLVDNIIAMAHKLKLTVVAEGVETVQQESLLDDLGCDWVQGYLYGKPKLIETI